MLHFPRWKIVVILGALALGALFASPNLSSKFPGNAVNLGLDLQGGSYLLLEVDEKSLQSETLQILQDETRIALRRARVPYRSISSLNDSVVVRLRSPEHSQNARNALQTLVQPVATSIFNPIAADNLSFSSPQNDAIALSYTPEYSQARLSSILSRSMEIVRRRVDELGTTDPSIQRRGSSRIILEVPGFDDPQRLKDIVGKTAKLNFQLVDVDVAPENALRGRIPPTSVLLYTQDPQPRPIVVKRRIIASGENLVDAQASFDDVSGAPQVNFRFDPQGGRSFGEATIRNVGKPFAIVLDKNVISSPVIQEPILGGSGRITGVGSAQDANDLALLLRAGALPAPLRVLEERTVGPGLGADSIRAGTIAAVLGLALVILFMSMAYGLFGIFANIALIANLTLILGALSILQATLTLPGVAGLVLTIGMAVDANVLIFERIREERAAGQSPVNALDFGYKRALSTILDANITTLIAAIVLFFVGAGPVRGFAVTLSIGILTSIFTAFTCTRLMIALWTKSARPTQLPIDTHPKSPHARA